ncbi:RNA recognition motif 2-domain-containing protein [Gymnopilus junonius]|uniref:RNA recognition motif 2-domain-containing protein n=1 Tax=Gymnopilus junonius TaxID=109634 RepID=A0A9P5NMU0_GYMJU|nr:RNA recognition motif 2-domain-containing protein [Gymnopilus junonius]
MSCPQPSIDLGTSQSRAPILAIEDDDHKSVSRFPPHSGPIPPEMSKDEESRIQRPSAPPSPKQSPLNPAQKKSFAPSTATRRTERDQPHSLLTPPLTPSSSIQTSTSRDSSVSAQPPSDTDDTPISEEIIDPDLESTRILLLENVNRQLSAEDLKSAIIESLVTFSSEKNAMDEHTKTPVLQLLRQDPLKGVNGRSLVSNGVFPIVFFDVRVAKVAQEVLTSPDFGRLHQCIGDEIDDKGERRWLSVRFVTLDELSKTLGYSSFLDGVNGSFSMSLQLLHQTTNGADDNLTGSVAGGLPASILDVKIDSEHGTISRGGFKINIVQNIVKSFGSVRVFEFSCQEVDHDGKCSLVYHVEYYDSREAATAFEDLSGKVMFGMKISVTRSPQQSGSSNVTVPFPNTSTAGESFIGLSAYPTTAQRKHLFARTRKDGGAKSYNDSNNIFPQPSPHVVSDGEASSPTFFYTSTPAFVEAPNNASALAVDVPRSALISAQHVRSQEPVWNGDNIHSNGPCYSPDGTCLYCPSRGPVPYSPGFYTISHSTPGAIYYPVPGSNMVNGTPIPNHGAPIYDYLDPQQFQPVPNAGPWGFDPAIAAVGTRPNALMPVISANVPSPGPFFLRDDSQIYQAGYIQTPDQNIAQPQHLTDNSSRPSIILPKALAPVSTPELSPSTYHPTPLSLLKYDTVAAITSPAVSGQNERNQLNIAKIEEGLDTRTTVMIKNIPNKMSDTDLTEYIGKVCPRRIDFLYLRMDFKNGCNVGYAFVNFISVQDLLHFAKERLGAKWNMFASEKVLQMSYANYQGKEALVEKFKNSAIMDERESWRPRIFYSSGSQQGLPEPFPAPTHIRRKERSSYNRGTLFPPNPHSNILHNYRPRQYRPGFVDDTQVPSHIPE